MLSYIYNLMYSVTLANNMLCNWKQQHKQTHHVTRKDKVNVLCNWKQHRTRHKQREATA